MAVEVDQREWAVPTTARGYTIGHKAFHGHPEARELKKQKRSVELSLEGCSRGSSF